MGVSLDSGVNEYLITDQAYVKVSITVVRLLSWIIVLIQESSKISHESRTTFAKLWLADKFFKTFYYLCKVRKLLQLKSTFLENDFHSFVVILDTSIFQNVVIETAINTTYIENLRLDIIKSTSKTILWCDTIGKVKVK